MRKLFVISFFIFGSISTSFAQEESEPNPTIQDLDFLIGTWEITFDFYDPRKPERGIVAKEVGIQTCEYDMELNGVPMFIVCEGKMEDDKGRERTFKEYTRYSRFVNSYQRMGIYSNWPAMALDMVYYHPETRTLDVRGNLQVRNLTERYQDYYYFNEDFSSYERKVVSNFSDMPASEYNLVFNSTAKKIK